MSLSDNRLSASRGKIHPAATAFRLIIFLAFAGIFTAIAASPAFAEAEIDGDSEVAAGPPLQVHSIEPVYVERGETNYMVTLRVHVTNNGDNENVSIDMAGKDDAGFILQNVRFTGTVAPGKSRMLMEQFQIRGETYEKISVWEPRQ